MNGNKRPWRRLTVPMAWMRLHDSRDLRFWLKVAQRAKEERVAMGNTKEVRRIIQEIADARR